MRAYQRCGKSVPMNGLRFAAVQGAMGEGLELKALYRGLPFVPGTMSILDVFRQEYRRGKVVHKYRLKWSLDWWRIAARVSIPTPVFLAAFIMTRNKRKTEIV
jgi:hypothetical protein